MSSCSGNCGSCASSGGCENQMENRMKHVKQAVLVLSGVSTAETVKTYAYRPTIVLDGVGDIVKMAKDGTLA